MRMILRCLLAVLASCALPVWADVVVQVGNAPGVTDESIALDGGTLDATVTGTTGTTNRVVVFGSSENVEAPGTGVVRIVASDGGLSSLNVTLADPTLGFSRLVMNLSAPGTGSVQFVVYDQLGEAFNATFSIGPGENFFTLASINDQLMTFASFVSTVSLGDVRSLRIGGFGVIGDGGGGSVPEPAPLTMLAFGLAGLWLSRRRPDGGGRRMSGKPLLS